MILRIRKEGVMEKKMQLSFIFCVVSEQRISNLKKELKRGRKTITFFHFLFTYVLELILQVSVERIVIRRIIQYGDVRWNNVERKAELKVGHLGLQTQVCLHR